MSKKKISLKKNNINKRGSNSNSINDASNSSKRASILINFMDKSASKRDKWIKRNNYYYKYLLKF